MEWNNEFTYAIGLFTADGCLSPDGRHLEFCSKDKEQVENFKKCLRLSNKITKKSRAQEKIKRYYRVQFGNVELYRFLQSIGLTPRKSLTLKKIDIPKAFFSDFLRGLFDGDGNFNIFIHPESQYPQIRVRIASASKEFLRWLQVEINNMLNTNGFITQVARGEHLEYGKADSIKILDFMYYSFDVIRLSRKFQKVEPYLSGRGQIGKGVRFRT